MSYETVKNTFSQKDYHTLISALDEALAVFQETSDDPDAALKDFVLNHYFKVWRGMASKGD